MKGSLRLDLSRSWRRLLIAACALVGTVACSDSTTRIDDAPYAGPPPYPDRRPKLPPAKGYFGYVSNNLSDTVTVLDLPSNEVVAEVVVGRDPVGIDGPHHLALDAQGNVYVVLSYPAPAKLPGPHAAHASATYPGFVVKLAADDLRALGEISVDPNPGEIAITPDSRTLLVTHFDLGRAADPRLDAEGQKATIAILDVGSVDSGTQPTKIKLCRAPHGLSVSPDSRTAYVACYGDDAVAILDLSRPDSPPVMVPVPARGPYSAILSNSGHVLAVGATDGKETRFVNTETQTLNDAAVLSQGAPYTAAWASDDSKLWIPTQSPDAILVADPATGALLKQRPLDASCAKPHEVTLARDGSALYVVCEGNHVDPSVILVLDPTTLETRGSMKVGIYPDRLAFSRTLPSGR